MTKNLIQKVAAGILIPLAIGCATTVQAGRNASEGYPEGMISGVEYQILTQSKVPYKLEEQVLYGDRQYFYEREQTPETLPMRILRYEDVTRELDLDSKKINLQSNKIYVPRKVEAKEYIKDKWIDGIVLRTDGIYRLKANMSVQKNSKGDYGYKIVASEDGASFAIKTIKILGEEYFFSYVEDSNVNAKGKLNYYLIPVKGAKINIENKCGNLSIYNENNIYRPTDINMFPDLFKDTTESGLQTKNTISN